MFGLKRWWAAQRAVGPGKDRHILPVCDGTKDPGVAGGERQGHVAGNRGDRQQLQFVRHCQRQQQCHPVINAGVTIDDDGVGAHGDIMADEGADGQERLTPGLCRATSAK